ncbi:4Fe-4S ferredoxin iron-sulfur-binding domain-containing protein [Halanaeroarchaeum sulfurireducens]|uniref:4Fe-4S ferredoxin iron-sulfur-binding domain-containing protein n=2 Tax=Halanaeroarchaeum sulfurireducens TaxID=1604004 RepID=A0A0F7P8F5_9EURY|nr:4Fe-4S ferredoxin iron-sulfur-binding domain-containing protein [Halanaeroarchaeum sulfurireducens]ALG81428.1 4Fe-4S ferredoxin iron-sulfur-binding domain-containing protein [Halanaeroarchaeum sulfurireducens]
MVESEVPDPEDELDRSEHDTDLGVAMAEDAQRVSRGDMSSETYWAKYDEAAAAEFGEDYRSTPNPAVDKTDSRQTIDDPTADQLSCAVGPMENVAEGLAATEGEDGPTWGMVIDLQKCVGCDSCTVACKAENRTQSGVTYNVVLEEERGEFPDVTRTNIPRPCMQCENPSCVQVCPVSATYKMENGIVNIDYDRCIGCRYCMVACPYGARYLDFGESYEDEVIEADEVDSPEFGVTREDDGPGASPQANATKCSFCYHRLGRGEEPACVETCIGDARYFGDLDADSEVSKMADSTRAFQLKEHTGNDPNVYYLR